MGIAEDKEFVDWAIQELVHGTETSSIKILGGLEPPLNSFEVKEYTDKSKSELKLGFEKAELIDEYTKVLAAQKLNNEITSREITEEMYKILQDTHYDKKYFAWYDIDEYFDDFYVISDKNIDDVIISECKRMLNQEEIIE